MSDEPGVERVDCDECGGYDLFYPDGSLGQVHRDGCSLMPECDCEQADCEECVERAEAHAQDPMLLSIGLRLLIAAIEDDEAGIGLALDDVPDCSGCERAVWVGVLQTAAHYGTQEFADVLRTDLLHVLDAAAERRAHGGE